MLHKADTSDLCFGCYPWSSAVLEAVFEIRVCWGTDLITSYVLNHCPTILVPKARGRQHAVIALSWKWVPVKILAGLWDIFTAFSHCYIHVIKKMSLCLSISISVSVSLSLTIFFSLNNQMLFKILSFVATDLRTVFWLSSSGCSESYYVSKREFIFLFLYHVSKENLGEGSCPLRMWCFRVWKEQENNDEF